jgi:phage virion morphogenesis protein
MVEIIVEDKEVRQALARLRRVTSDLRAPMSSIGEYLSKRVDDGFRKEQDPYGVPWAPLNPRTIKRKQKQRPPAINKVLQNSGLFRSSFSYSADKDSVEIGSNRVSKSGAPIGLFHQLGTGRLPKRETLPNDSQGLPDRDREEIIDILSGHLKNVW